MAQCQVLYLSMLCIILESCFKPISLLCVYRLLEPLEGQLPWLKPNNEPLTNLFAGGVKTGAMVRLFWYLCGFDMVVQRSCCFL